MIASLLIVLLLALLFSFGLVALAGAPYLPTGGRQRRQALKLLDLPPGGMLYDLGCGDGRMLSLAAAHGFKAVGYELNPLLWLVAWMRCRRHSGRVKVIWGSFWNASLDDADGVYVFLIDHFMGRLDRLVRLRHRPGPLRLVSYGYTIPGKRPVSHSGGLYLYEYAAN